MRSSSSQAQHWQFLFGPCLLLDTCRHKASSLVVPWRGGFRGALGEGVAAQRLQLQPSSLHSLIVVTHHHNLSRVAPHFSVVQQQCWHGLWKGLWLGLWLCLCGLLH